MTIAVLLATFNRKDQTLACLETLYHQQQLEAIRLEVYLTDDASKDGTAMAVLEAFPEVHLFKGSGTLFWAGGMRNSWSEAVKADPDYYLLLNDDTLLDPLSLRRLLGYSTQCKDGKAAICVGSTADEGKISYGGHKLKHKGRVQYENVFSMDSYLECDMANANIMLVPREIVVSIGILSARYTHSIADFDYSLRAGKAGFKVMVAPGIGGSCRDDHGNNWKSAGTSLKERIRYLKSPKGLAYSEYLHFIRLHFPLHFPEAFFKLWMKTLFPQVWDNLKNQA